MEVWRKPAISQSPARRKVKRLILVSLGVGAEGLQDLREKKGLRGAAKGTLEVFGGRKSWHPRQGVRRFML